MNEAEKEGVTSGAIAMRMSRGKYRGLKLRKLNARLIFVLV